MKREIELNSLEETKQLAAAIGSSLKGGEIIELVGDIGSGKTTFVSGLASGANNESHVSSPTFTLENIYEGDPQIRHLDLYRIEDSKMLEYSLQESLASKDVVVIEWAGLVDHLLPNERLKISFQTLSDFARKVTLEFPKAMQYLLVEVGV